MDIDRLLRQARLSGETDKNTIGMMLSNRMDMATGEGGMISVKNFDALADDILTWRGWSATSVSAAKAAPGPLGRQVYPVLVGRMKGGDIVIQTRGGYVRVDAKHARGLVPAILVVIGADGSDGYDNDGEGGDQHVE